MTVRHACTCSIYIFSVSVSQISYKHVIQNMYS